MESIEKLIEICRPSVGGWIHEKQNKQQQQQKNARENTVHFCLLYMERSERERKRGRKTTQRNLENIASTQCDIVLWHTSTPTFTQSPCNLLYLFVCFSLALFHSHSLTHSHIYLLTVLFYPFQHLVYNTRADSSFIPNKWITERYTESIISKKWWQNRLTGRLELCWDTKEPSINCYSF